MASAYKVCLSSPPDRDRLVAEIFFDDVQWAELNQESGTLMVEVYPRRDNQPWHLEYDEVVAALKEAKRRLAD